MCAFSRDKDSCHGDSGGPLTVLEHKRFTLIGIISFGPENCANNLHPGVYARVTEVLEWIRSKAPDIQVNTTSATNIWKVFFEK